VNACVIKKIVVDARAYIILEIQIITEN